jgi:hypothetical protein
MGLTAQDVEVLRTADTYTFQGNQTGHQIIARLSDGNPDNSTGRDQDHVIPVFGYVVLFSSAHAGATATSIVTNTRAFTMISRNVLTETWTSLLRRGDEPVLVWWANRTSEELQRMDLANDELYLAIYRHRREHSRFHVAARVTAADSNERMIRVEQ